MEINGNDYDINSIIEMAWCDKTSFDSIKLQTNLSEKEVIKIMRSNLKKSVKINQDYEKKKYSLVKLQNKKIIEKKIINNDQTLVDICTILKECSIDEISKYLIKHNKKKGFPNISVK